MGEFMRRASTPGTRAPEARRSVGAPASAGPGSTLAQLRRALDTSARTTAHETLAETLGEREAPAGASLHEPPSLRLQMEGGAPARGEAAPGVAPVQRVAVQIVANNGGLIQSVNVGGRAGSLWPQERHHTTPWQVYLDTLNRELRGLSLGQAVGAMNGLDDFLHILPGWGLVDDLEQGKRGVLQGDIQTLAQARLRANQLGPNSPLLALALQDYINAWITVRSRLPLAQADVGGEAGNVAGDTLTARTAEAGGNVDDEDLRDAFLNMFDFATVANVLTVDEENAEDEYENLGLDPDQTEISLDELREAVFIQHARSVRRAYPNAFDQVFDSIDDMVAVMEERWEQGGDTEDDEDQDVVMSESSSVD